MQEKLSSYSDEQAARVGYLIAGFIRNTLSEKEHDELDEWVTEKFENQLLFEELTEEETIDYSLAFLDSLNSKKALQSIKLRRKKTKSHNAIWKYAVAAAILLLIGTFITFQFINTDKKRIDSPLIADIPPGGNKATLTFSDGSTLSLEEAATGLLKKDNSAFITKTSSGEIAYSSAAGESLNTGTNTLSTPNGGQYALQLPDGSKVWLNASSSLIYPTSFTDKERMVSLSGEGYFEIAKDASKPFKVKLRNGSVVEVLGTHFNVMSYDDEPAIQTTLTEGSIKWENQIVKPGQQVSVNTGNRQLTTDNQIDIDEVLAWKNGNFNFKDASIQQIMRQLARWYDVTVVYNAKSDYLFNADIVRNEPVSKVLHLLELTGRIHFKIENKTIYVLP
jgi:transmembrane sensor